jgi:hypothetical protein
MNILEPPQSDLFRTDPLMGLPADSRVDRRTGTILGAKAMQAGPLNSGDSRPWKVDQTTLTQLAGLVNRSNLGVKMRFAHPNMSRDGMGRHLGRATNARVVGEGQDAYVAIDMQLADSAKRAPNGNLHEHVLDLASETPDLFGLSIAPLLDSESMRKIEPDEQGLVPIRLKALRAIDVVDEPAATRGGLFSLDSDSLADLPFQATALLDTFFAETPAGVLRQRIDEFVTTYLHQRGDEMTTTETKPTENMEKQPPIEATKEQARAELSRRAELTALCKLASVSDKDRDLLIEAGFSRAEAQDWLKASGKLSAINPPVEEGSADRSERKPTDDDKFGAEYDEHADIYQRQGVTREAYIKSRKKD